MNGKDSYTYTKMVDPDAEALRIHAGYFGSDSDSGKSDFDDEYKRNKPPPVFIHPTRIIVVTPLTSQDGCYIQQPTDNGSLSSNYNSNSFNAACNDIYSHENINYTKQYDDTWTTVSARKKVVNSSRISINSHSRPHRLNAVNNNLLENISLKNNSESSVRKNNPSNKSSGTENINSIKKSHNLENTNLLEMPIEAFPKTKDQGDRVPINEKSEQVINMPPKTTGFAQINLNKAAHSIPTNVNTEKHTESDTCLNNLLSCLCCCL